MSTKSQLLKTEPKTKTKQTKKTTRTEPQKWRSHGGLAAGEWERERGKRYRE